MKRLITLITLLAALSSAALAYDFTVDGLSYTINDDTSVSVGVEGNRQNLVGELNIPASVIYEGKSYSVTEIDGSGFWGCVNITSVNIPNTIKIISNGAFGGCDNLTSISLATSVETIGPWAFSYCKNLASISLPNSVLEIGEQAFSYCPVLSSIDIPNSVKKIGADVFLGTKWWNNQPDGLVYVGKVAYKYKGSMPSGTSIAFENGLLGIAGQCFNGCTNLVSVTIPNSMVFIGYYAFKDCSELATISVDNADFEIGSGAFEGTKWWANLPDGLVYIGKIAYKYKGDMPDGTAISIKEGTIRIADDCFRYCKALTSVDIPGSVTKIGDGTFRGCNGLTSITIPASVTEIGDGTFQWCYGLTSIEIPNSVTSIGDFAFNGCSGLTSIEIPNSVTKIGASAFSGCTNMANMSVESSNAIYDSRDNCNAIIETATNTLLTGCKNTVIPNSVTSIGDFAFNGCSGLTSVIVPNSVTSIGSYAFGGCTGLTAIEIPNSVKRIKNDAFLDCSRLTSVTIGNAVTSIGSFAFSNCTGLTSVTNNAQTPQFIEANVFYNVDIANCWLKVWHEAVSKYKAADVWKDFLIEDMGGVEGVEANDAAKEIEGYYDLRGIRIAEPYPGQPAIVRHTDGSSRKIITK